MVKGRTMRFTQESCAIVGAADFNASHFRSMEFDHVVAADGGWSALEGIGVHAPDAVGDFDSLGYVPDAAHVMRYPQEKDASDLELASARADELGASAFVYYGCLSGRLDQTIAAIDSMRHWSKVGKRVFGIGDLFCVAIVNPAHSLEFRPFDASSLAESSPYGSYVSVFAVGGDAHGVNERGLKYGISDFTLRGDTTRGLSNELCGDAVRIDVESGQLLVTFPLDAWSHLSAVFA